MQDVKIGSRSIRWSEPPEQRQLAQVTDIGIAFASKMAEAIAGPDVAIPAVYRSVTVLTDTVAALGMHEVERGMTNPDTPPLLASPNPAETYATTLRQIMASLLFRGNAYLWPRTRNDLGEIQSVYVLNPDEVTCTWDRDRLYPEYVWRDKRMEPDRDIVHIPINRFPGEPKGLSPITAASRVLDAARAELELAVNLMLDDATPGGAIKVPEKITHAEATAILEIWEDTHQGRKRPGVLGNGSDWVSMTFSPVDAQFLESRNFTVQDIARLFGVPANFLLVPSGDSLTYSTTETLFRMFLTSTVAPSYLEPIEQAFSRMLPNGRTARFDTAQLLRADIEARYRAAAIGIEAGFLTADDVRRDEGLPPLPADYSPPALNGKVLTNA